ncbi:MAG: asparagine synthase-related protein [Oligoflexus sp.]
MIGKLEPADLPQSLRSDLAGEYPLYIYLSHDKKILFYSTSLTTLLGFYQIKKPLNIRSDSVGFLLQNGVIPPPRTIFENLYILSIGWKVDLFCRNNEIVLDFKYKFPFLTIDRQSSFGSIPRESQILELIADATMSRLNLDKPNFLFHSAGKDSNTIALALAEAGWQDKVTLISHESKGEFDESQISASIAKKLGFRHRILKEIDRLGDKQWPKVIDFFSRMPFPCVDPVTLAYPLYVYQMPELVGANIIDGGGNDSYMLTPLTTREHKILPFTRLASQLHLLRNFVNSENILNPLLRTSAEWFGMMGFSYADSRKLYSDASSVYHYWKTESSMRRNWDVIDFKTDILTSVVACELHIRKARLFADAFGCNLVLPFANEKVAQYFLGIRLDLLVDQSTRKNKIILRSILKNGIGLDSDAIGKMGYSYDVGSIVLNNLPTLLQEIKDCSLWDSRNGLPLILNRLLRNINESGWKGRTTRFLIYRLYLISGWYNHSIYTVDGPSKVQI